MIESTVNPPVSSALGPSDYSTTLMRAGTAELRRANGALFAGGFATFALLYCVQPLLPVFSRDFSVSAAQSSLVLSLATGAMAVALVVVSSLSDAWGRKAIMGVSLALAAILMLGAAGVAEWRSLLVLRVFVGLALAGLPAVAMGYLAEEVHPDSIGIAMGLYISGNALGGMAGRFISGILADFFSWRVAVGGVGILCAGATAIFWIVLPPSRNFQPRRLAAGELGRTFVRHLREPGLRRLFAVGFLLMGAFVTLYNYIGYRLVAPPYRLRESAVAAIFTVYLVGAVSSTWAGHLAARRGRRWVLWRAVAAILAGAALTLVSNLAGVILGVTLVTAGFFAGHSVASSWVGRRVSEARGQASGLYLFFYYLGGSVVGWAGGHGWAAFGWPGVAAFVGGSALIALVIALDLRRLPRLRPATTPEVEPAEPAG